MANAIVGTLRALLTADTAQFESGMRKASVITGQFGTATKAAEAPASALSGKMVALSAAAGAMAATLGLQAGRALVAFGKEAVNSAGHLVDLQKKTGESLTSLQRMQHVADQTGTSLDAMTNAAFMLRTRLAGGGNSVNKALDDLRRVSGEAGLSVRSSADEILGALSQVKDEQERTRLGTLLFGRSFRELAGAVTDGYDEIAKGAKVSSDAQIKALSDAGDAWDAFVRDRKTQFRSLLGEMVINARELADIFSNQGLFGGAVGASLEFRRRQQMGTVGGRRTDIELGTSATRAASDATEDLGTGLKNVADTAEKAATAQRAFINSLGEREIEDAARALEELEDAQRAQRKLTNELGEEEIRQHEEALQQKELTERQWRDFQNMLGERYIEAEQARIERAQLRHAEMVAFWRGQLDQLSRASIGSLGSLFIGNIAHDISGELRTAADEAHTEFLKIQRDGEATAEQIQNAFNKWREAEDKANLSFAERWKDFWGGIKQTFVNILNDMLEFFLRNFITGLLKGLATAKIGEALGSAISGAALGAAAGGGAAAAGGAAAGVGTGAAAGGGVGATIAGLATNPITIAAAAAIGIGLLIGKKGAFRGGEEALQVNPRRDQFLAQFGPSGTGPRSGFGVLAAQLTAWSGLPGGGPLFTALRLADSMSEWQAAQGAIVAEYAKHGIRTIQSFQMGGFTPPGVTQLALLHGGAHGELHVPLDAPLSSATGGPTIININASIRAWDSRDVSEVFRNQIIPQVKQALLLNTDGFVTAHQRASIVGKR